MTTTTAAASSGTDTATAEAIGQEKPFGMAKVRETETYHTFSVAHDALSEAERLCAEVYRAVTDAYFRDLRKNADGTGLTAVQTAESPQMQSKIREALNCLEAAQAHMRQLLFSNYDLPF